MAIVQRVQKPLFAEPFLFLDQNAVHHRDLACRPAKAQEPDPRPDLCSLGECGIRVILHARPEYQIGDAQFNYAIASNVYCASMTVG